jgi:hypothetical protein
MYLTSSPTCRQGTPAQPEAVPAGWAHRRSPNGRVPGGRARFSDPWGQDSTGTPVAACSRGYGVTQFLTEFGIVTVPFGEEHWRTAFEAYRRFGKGRHAAALNIGDCMSYATAKLSRQPLLCTGADFARTDLAVA